MDDFLLRAALAGMLAALAAAPLGCLVVWRRMAYFGDATAHAALLGVAAALLLDLPVGAGVAVLAAAMALTVSGALALGRYAVDTLLGVFAHAALAAGLVALALVPGPRVDLDAALFGDILAVAPADIGVIAGGAAFIVLAVALRWRALVTATISPDLAVAEGRGALADRLTVTLLLALFVALSLRVVGALLVTSLLVIPAAAARPLARSPEAMALMAAAIGAMAVMGGLGLSLLADTPAGPSIILGAALAFGLANLAAALRG